MRKDDWRRSNVDTIIKMLNHTIKSVNRRVKFGISPFGVWRNKSRDPMGSNTKAGLTNYDDLYADIMLWLREGWIDYVVPQLYWETGHKLADYNVLLDWWAQNSHGKHLFIGHGIYRGLEAKSGNWRNPNEIPTQIKLIRSKPTAHGSVYYNTSAFFRNPQGWNDSLRNNYYKYPSLVPPMKWIDSIPPLKPLVEKVAGLKETRVMYRGAEPIKGFALYSIATGRQPTVANGRLIEIIIADKYVDIDLDKYTVKGERIVISAVDRNNNVGEGLVLR
jgi:uncharacterized lipoprotein YddW (UPF0748 family)